MASLPIFSLQPERVQQAKKQEERRKEEQIRQEEVKKITELIAKKKRLAIARSRGDNLSQPKLNDITVLRQPLTSPPPSLFPSTLTSSSSSVKTASNGIFADVGSESEENDGNRDEKNNVENTPTTTEMNQTVNIDDRLKKTTMAQSIIETTPEALSKISSSLLIPSIYVEFAEATNDLVNAKYNVESSEYIQELQRIWQKFADEWRTYLEEKIIESSGLLLLANSNNNDERKSDNEDKRATMAYWSMLKNRFIDQVTFVNDILAETETDFSKQWLLGFPDYSEGIQKLLLAKLEDIRILRREEEESVNACGLDDIVTLNDREVAALIGAQNFIVENDGLQTNEMNERKQQILGALDIVVETISKRWEKWQNCIDFIIQESALANDMNIKTELSECKTWYCMLIYHLRVVLQIIRFTKYANILHALIRLERTKQMALRMKIELNDNMTRSATTFMLENSQTKLSKLEEALHSIQRNEHETFNGSVYTKVHTMWHNILVKFLRAEFGKATLFTNTEKAAVNDVSQEQKRQQLLRVEKQRSIIETYLMFQYKTIQDNESSFSTSALFGSVACMTTLLDFVKALSSCITTTTIIDQDEKVEEKKQQYFNITTNECSKDVFDVVMEMDTYSTCVHNYVDAKRLNLIDDLRHIQQKAMKLLTFYDQCSALENDNGDGNNNSEQKKACLMNVKKLLHTFEDARIMLEEITNAPHSELVVSLELDLRQIKDSLQYNYLLTQKNGNMNMTTTTSTTTPSTTTTPTTLTGLPTSIQDQEGKKKDKQSSPASKTGLRPPKGKPVLKKNLTLQNSVREFLKLAKIQKKQLEKDTFRTKQNQEDQSVSAKSLPDVAALAQTFAIQLEEILNNMNNNIETINAHFVEYTGKLMNVSQNLRKLHQQIFSEENRPNFKKQESINIFERMKTNNEFQVVLVTMILALLKKNQPKTNNIAQSKKDGSLNVTTKELIEEEKKENNDVKRQTDYISSKNLTQCTTTFPPQPGSILAHIRLQRESCLKCERESGSDCKQSSEIIVPNEEKEETEKEKEEEEYVVNDATNENSVNFDAILAKYVEWVAAEQELNELKNISSRLITTGEVERFENVKAKRDKFDAELRSLEQAYDKNLIMLQQKRNFDKQAMITTNRCDFFGFPLSEMHPFQQQSEFIEKCVQSCQGGDEQKNEQCFKELQQQYKNIQNEYIENVRKETASFIRDKYGSFVENYRSKIENLQTNFEQQQNATNNEGELKLLRNERAQLFRELLATIQSIRQGAPKYDLKELSATIFALPSMDVDSKTLCDDIFWNQKHHFNLNLYNQCEKLGEDEKCLVGDSCRKLLDLQAQYLTTTVESKLAADSEENKMFENLNLIDTALNKLHDQIKLVQQKMKELKDQNPKKMNELLQLSKQWRYLSQDFTSTKNKRNDLLKARDAQRMLFQITFLKNALKPQLFDKIDQPINVKHELRENTTGNFCDIFPSEDRRQECEQRQCKNGDKDNGGCWDLIVRNALDNVNDVIPSRNIDEFKSQLSFLNSIRENFDRETDIVEKRRLAVNYITLYESLIKEREILIQDVYPDIAQLTEIGNIIIEISRNMGGESSAGNVSGVACTQKINITHIYPCGTNAQEVREKLKNTSDIEGNLQLHKQIDNLSDEIQVKVAKRLDVKQSIIDNLGKTTTTVKSISKSSNQKKTKLQTIKEHLSTFAKDTAEKQLTLVNLNKEITGNILTLIALQTQFNAELDRKYQAKQKQLEEERLRAEAERQEQLRQEQLRQQLRLQAEEAQRQAQIKAQIKAQQKAATERKVQEEIERKAQEEIERKAQEEAERKAQEEIERKVQEEIERKAREEIEQKAREDAQRQEEAERKAQEEAERKAQEEARLGREDCDLLGAFDNNGALPGWETINQNLLKLCSFNIQCLDAIAYSEFFGQVYLGKRPDIEVSRSFANVVFNIVDFLPKVEQEVKSLLQVHKGNLFPQIYSMYQIWKSTYATLNVFKTIPLKSNVNKNIIFEDFQQLTSNFQKVLTIMFSLYPALFNNVFDQNFMTNEASLKSYFDRKLCVQPENIPSVDVVENLWTALLNKHKENLATIAEKELLTFSKEVANLGEKWNFNILQLKRYKAEVKRLQKNYDSIINQFFTLLPSSIFDAEEKTMRKTIKYDLIIHFIEILILNESILKNPFEESLQCTDKLQQEFVQAVSELKKTCKNCEDLLTRAQGKKYSAVKKSGCRNLFNINDIVE